MIRYLKASYVQIGEWLSFPAAMVVKFVWTGKTKDDLTQANDWLTRLFKQKMLGGHEREALAIASLMMTDDLEENKRLEVIQNLLKALVQNDFREETLDGFRKKLEGLWD